jgi:hypothetical protein
MFGADYQCEVFSQDRVLSKLMDLVKVGNENCQYAACSAIRSIAQHRQLLQLHKIFIFPEKGREKKLMMQLMYKTINHLLVKHRCVCACVLISSNVFFYLFVSVFFCSLFPAPNRIKLITMGLVKCLVKFLRSESDRLRFISMLTLTSVGITRELKVVLSVAVSESKPTYS